MGTALGPINLERMVRAVEQVRLKLLRVTSQLNSDNIPYAVVDGNAVMAWVSTVDDEAVRNTKDVNIMLRREDLQHAIESLGKIGFIYRKMIGIDMFLEGPSDRARTAVHVVFANERVKEHETVLNPDVSDAVCAPDEGFYVLSLEKLVQIKLTAFRDKERTHLRDFIELGMIDTSWLSKYPAELSKNLQFLFDNPQTNN